MSEHAEEALRRQTFLRTTGLLSAGTRRCAGSQQRAELFSKRRATPGQGKARYLDCWRAER
jgi:hypothetical protein